MRVARVTRLSDRHSRVSFTALLANTINLESVAGGRVVVSAPDFLLELIHFLGKKFDRTATLGADHVMMAAAIVLVLVASDAIMKGDFAGQSAFGQQFKRAIDRGKTDTRIFLVYQAMQFVGREMIAGFKKRAQDGVALRSLLEAHALEMPVQDILRLPHHFAGNGGLVINAFLQHEWIEMRISPEARLDTGPAGWS